MNLLKAYFIYIFLILSCKSNEHRNAPFQEDLRQNVYLTSQDFGLHEKMVHILVNGRQVGSFELASKTLNSSQIDLEYNFTIDQIYMSRNQVYELVLNEADIVFLSNDLSLKSKNTLRAYQDCHQFLLVFESNDTKYKADLIFIPLQRELVVADKNHFGIVCIEDKKISLDFRSEIDSEDVTEILKKTIFSA
ncbi:MAG: hypothetical protein AB8G05_18225 [Oligoflexales bacterium]